MAINITNTVKEAYSRYFRNRTLLIIGFIGALVGLALSLAINFMLMPFIGIRNNPSAATALLTSPMFWAEAIAAFVVFGLMEVFIAGVMISAVADGDDASIGSAVRNAASRYVSLIGACIASAGIVILGMIPTIVVFGILAVLPNSVPAIVLGILGLVGGLLMIIPAYVSLRVMLADVFCVVGKKRAVAAVEGSWSVLKGNLWQVMGISIAIGFIEVVISMPFTILVNQSVGQFVEMLLSYPVTIALVLVYMQLVGSSKKKPSRRKGK